MRKLLIYIYQSIFERLQVSYRNSRSSFLETIEVIRDNPSSLKIKRLDWYIIKKFLTTYIFAIGLIISIAVVFDINERLDKFLMPEVTLQEIIYDYYFSFIPYYSNLFSPLFVFISVIFFTSKMASNSEIIAILASGVSFKRLLRPYLISATIIAIFTFFMSSYIIPPSNVKRLKFEDKYIDKVTTDYARNIQMQPNPGEIIYIERYDDVEKVGYRFSLDRFENKRLVSRLTGQSIKYDTLNRWTINNYVNRKIEGMVEVLTKGDAIDTTLAIQPGDFFIIPGSSQRMTNAQLKEYLEKQKSRGVAGVKEFEIEYEKRYANPFMALILTFIGMSLSARKNKGGMGLNLGIGLLLSFSYILFSTISSTFAVNGNTNTWLAVWIPNIIYAIIGAVLYHQAPK